MGRAGARRELNYEECLASTEELEAIDEDELVPWSKYIWEHVLELAPEHLEALELVVEYHAEVLDDPDGAAPYLASLLAVAPEHPRGLHFAVVLASLDEDLDEARRRLLQLCETSPATAIVQGTFDYFDENDLLFLEALAPRIVDAIDGMGEPIRAVPVLRAPSFPYFEQTVEVLGGDIHGLLGLSAFAARSWVIDGGQQAILVRN